MPELRWTGRGYFSHLNEMYEPGETVAVDDAAAADLLAHYSGDWERVDTGDGDDDELDEPDTGSDTYPREDLKAMEYTDLQSLAAEADHEDVDGRSSREDIIDALSDQGG